MPQTLFGENLLITNSDYLPKTQFLSINHIANIYIYFINKKQVPLKMKIFISGGEEGEIKKKTEKKN